MNQSCKKEQITKKIPMIYNYVMIKNAIVFYKYERK